jgi:hypothetical protein
MNSRRLLLCLGALACALLAFAATASAAKKSPAPVITSITPLKLKVGEKLTVRGRNFIPGKGKTRVVFVRRGGGTAFARAEKASKTKLVVTLPAQLDKVLDGKAARVQIRVLGRKFGKLSAARKSPIVSPADSIDSVPDPGDVGPAAPEADCDKDGAVNSADGDDDNDLLADTDETTLATDPCNADTDGDGVQDGYEYFSALDLNRTVLFGSRPPTPYPGKRPYPNPLFIDAATDFDGDGLDLVDEHLLWNKFGGHSTPLNYSDGLQTTVDTPLPSNPLRQQQDTASSGEHWGDGMLDDGERDADGDGLSNWDESHGRMLQGWWTGAYEKETAYPLVYAPVDMIDPDSDGDGVDDGADDQDHDGLSNAFEVARPWNWILTYVSTGYDGSDGEPTYPANPYARVQPYNPCKPVFSESCHRHPPFDYYADDEDWQGLNPSQAGTPGVIPGPLFP